MLMIGKPLNAQQRLMKAVVDIMGKDYFTPVSGVLMVLKQSIQAKDAAEKATSTAMTNGIEITYAEEFVDSLSDAQFRFLILHEAYHCMYKHLTTWEWMYDEDPSIANQACDHVINLKLIAASKDPSVGEDFITMPEVGLADPQFTGMDSAEIFHKLRKRRAEEEKCQGDKDKESDGGGDDGDDGDDGPQTDQGQGGKPKSGNGKPGNERQGFDDHDWEGAKELSDEKKAEIGRKLDEAVRQGALLAGKTGSGGMREIEELLSAKVRWQDELREYAQTVCAGKDYSTWRRPNRRFVSAGVYLPSSISETVGEVVIGIDTSGSIGGDELSQFLGECAAIFAAVKPEAVRLLYWDTAVCRAERYTQDQLDQIVTSTKPEGGGGTAPSCVPMYMNTNNIKPQVSIMLTDGYVGSDWGANWPSPVVWCVIGNKTAKATTGKTIIVE
jgi:predicted metal-dependent peptidase